jgi:hypothetical protein
LKDRLMRPWSTPAASYDPGPGASEPPGTKR